MASAATPDAFPITPEPLPPRIPDHVLLRRIGGGSYGQVWLARSATGAYRAAKVVYRCSFERDRPYEREFEGIQKFEPISRSHPGLMHILHVGRDDAAGYFYYIMELADAAALPVENGEAHIGDEANKTTVSSRASSAAFDPIGYVARTLGYDLSQRGRLPFEECVELGLSLTDALQFLHRQGLVHRDVKPSNIIFVGGVPKLADIGLVTEAGQTLSCVGTEGFIPPEGPGTQQADLYSLGKVLYEISTGKDRHDYPEPLTNLGALPEQESLLELNEVIFRACAAQPRDRYPSAQAMHRDLQVVQNGKSVKRLHLLERRLAVVTRIICVVALLMLLVGCAYLQVSHAHKAATQRLVRLQVANAVRHMEESDFPGALPWIAESLRVRDGNPVAQEMHRYRFESVWRQCPRLAAVCLHQNRIYDAAFSPDGRLFVTASADHTARVWNSDSGQEVLPPLKHDDEVRHVIFSPDGRRIVTVTHEAVMRIWDAATGQPLCAPVQNRFEIWSIAFSPDGKRIVTGAGAVGEDNATVTMRELANGERVNLSRRPAEDLGEARIWDAATGQAVGRVFPQALTIRSAAFSPDGAQIVTAGDDKTAVIWNAITGDPVTPPLKHSGKVRCAVFSPDARRVLTASEDCTAQLWDPRTGQPCGPPLRHYKGVLYAAFSPDGRRIVTTSRDQTACLWDSFTGQLACLPLRHDSDVRYAEFSPDGRRLVTAGSEPVVRVWDAATGELLARLTENNNGSLATFSPEGRRLLTVSRDHLARLWDLLPLSPTTPSLHHEDRVNSIEFNRQGTRVLTASQDCSARVWDAATGQPVTPPLGRRDLKETSCFRATFSPDGQNALAFGILANLYDTATGKLRLSLADGAAGTCAAFSRDGAHIVTGSARGTVGIWGTSSAWSLNRALSLDQYVDVAVFSPNGCYVATASGEYTRLANHEDQIRVWDANSGRLLSPIMKIKGLVSSLSFSPDGGELLSSSVLPALEEREAQIWNWRTGQPAAPALRHHDGVPWAEFSADGRRVLTASFDKTACIWDAKTGQPLVTLHHARQVEHAAFSPDGRRVVTACQDGAARVWDAATGEPVSVALKHAGPIWWATFSPDGRQVATASDDHTACIWELSKNQRPLSDLLLLAELLSGERYDSTGNPMLMEPKDVLAAWQTLRAEYPADFAVSEAEALAWEEREAEASEKAEQWFAAVFHLNRLVAAKPEEVSYVRRRAAAYARWSE